MLIRNFFIKSQNPDKCLDWFYKYGIIFVLMGTEAVDVEDRITERRRSAWD